MEDKKMEVQNVRLEPSDNGGFVLTYTKVNPPKKGQEGEAQRYEDRYKDVKETFGKGQHEEALSRMSELSGTMDAKEDDDKEIEDETEDTEEQGMEENPSAMPGAQDNRLPHEYGNED